MPRPARPTRPSAALVVASLALAAALAPPAYSAMAPKLGKNTVGSPQIKNESIQTADLGRNVVKSSRIGTGQVRRSDLANGSVDFSKIADGTVGRAELSSNSVDGTKIADGSVTQTDLASPVRSGGWTFLPITDVPVAADAAIALGSLSANGGGPLVLQQSSRLTITGQVYVQAIETAATPFKGRLACNLTLDGTNLTPGSILRIEQGDELTFPVTGTASVAAGTHDVGLGCRNPTNAPVTMNVGRVSVGVVAVPQ
jgi:hypothetical protein